MKAEQIERLVKELVKKQVDYKSYDGEIYKVNLIQKGNESLLEQIIREHLLDNRDEDTVILQSKIGLLEAKVKFYEEIISKSTFAPLIERAEIVNNKVNNFEEIKE